MQHNFLNLRPYRMYILNELSFHVVSSRLLSSGAGGAHDAESYLLGRNRPQRVEQEKERNRRTCTTVGHQSDKPQCQIALRGKQLVWMSLFVVKIINGNKKTGDMQWADLVFVCWFCQHCTTVELHTNIFRMPFYQSNSFESRKTYGKPYLATNYLFGHLNSKVKFNKDWDSGKSRLPTNSLVQHLD